MKCRVNLRKRGQPKRPRSKTLRFRQIFATEEQDENRNDLKHKCAAGNM